jgi:hypothetical protein
MDAPALRSYIDGMCRLICRRIVALVVAYAVALNLVLPLLVTFASSAEAVTVAGLCAADRSGSPADPPNKPRPVCPLACLAPDCGVNGLLVGGSGSAALLVTRAARPLFFIRLDGQAPPPRDIGAQFARAPPRA